MVEKRNNRIFVAPKYSINLETTNRCCLNCFMCCQPVIEKKRGFIDTALVRKVVEDIADHFGTPEDVRVQLIGQGESLLHPSIFEIIEIVKKKNFRVDIVTNAVAMDEKRRNALLASSIDEIKISFYGWDKVSYKKIHGRDVFAKTLGNIIHLLHQNPHFRVSLHLLDCQAAEGVIDNLENLWSNFPVDIVATYGLRNIRNILTIRNPDNKELLLAPEPSATYYSKACINSLPIIHWDGSVSPCVYDYNSKCSIGNILTDSYGDILDGKARKQFEDAAMDGKLGELYEEDFCQMCSDIDNMKKVEGDIVPIPREDNRSALPGRQGGDDFLEKYFPLSSQESWASTFGKLLFEFPRSCA